MYDSSVPSIQEQILSIKYLRLYDVFHDYPYDKVKKNTLYSRRREYEEDFLFRQQEYHP